MAAVRRAVDLGVPFEIDVALCASGEVVVLHDDNLDRTTDGKGPVASASLEQLEQLDAGRSFSLDFAGERIPTLAQVLDFATQVAVNIEIKSAKPRSPTANAVVDVVEAAGAVDRVMVSSFDPFILEQVKLRSPSILRGQICGTMKNADLNPFEKFALRHLLLNGRAEPDLLMLEQVLITEGGAVALSSYPFDEDFL